MLLHKTNFPLVILIASEESRTPAHDIPRPFTLPTRTILLSKSSPHNTNTVYIGYNDV